MAEEHGHGVNGPGKGQWAAAFAGVWLAGACVVTDVVGGQAAGAAGLQSEDAGLHPVLLVGSAACVHGMLAVRLRPCCDAVPRFGFPGSLWFPVRRGLCAGLVTACAAWRLTHTQARAGPLHTAPQRAGTRVGESDRLQRCTRRARRLRGVVLDLAVYICGRVMLGRRAASSCMGRSGTGLLHKETPPCVYGTGEISPGVAYRWCGPERLNQAEPRLSSKWQLQRDAYNAV